MASEETHELLSRTLPELPLNPSGEPVDTALVENWCVASAELINALRQRVVDLEAQVESGADAFNRMVRLGNQAAENIVANAHNEAERIRAEALQGTTAAAAVPAMVPMNPKQSDEFLRSWKEEASIDERVADKTFFEQDYEEPSREWILSGQ